MTEYTSRQKENNNQKAPVPFNGKELEKMIERGFTHVQVSAYTRDKSLDYVDPHYIILTPLKLAKGNQTGLDIYESIHSELLLNWANAEEGIKVWVVYL
ncbi:MAG: hypothetical protein C5B52_15105 [Bacteroidetes bacterium]|nr:MAG: hypothetical protein C5B52_15105 [Bacteroidota bacterium]